MKRFTETDKWKDTWFRKLESNEKLLWFYILDNCDNAGFFEMDIDMCCFFTGLSELEIEGAIKGLDRGLLGARVKNLYWVKNFLRHQKNDSLNPLNNAHKQIIRLVNDRGDLFDKNIGSILGLNSPTGKGIGKGNNKTEDFEYSDEFEKFWKPYPKKVGKGDAFKAFKKSKGKPQIDALVAIVKAHSESDQWKRDNGKYIPNPATWLNQRRWDDLIETKSASNIGSDGKERIIL